MKNLFKKLSILVMLNLVIISPVLGLDEGFDEKVPISVKIVDLDENPMSGIYFKLIDNEGFHIGGSGASDPDGMITNFGTTVEKKRKIAAGYCFELLLFYYHGEHGQNSYNKGRPLKVVGSPMRCFENNTMNYTIVVNELNNKPAELAMYNMANMSYNLAKQSEETSNKSYYLSFFALLLSFLVVLRPLICTLIYICYKFKKTPKHFDGYYMFFNSTNTIGSVRVVFLFIVVTAVLISFRALFPNNIFNWLMDILITAFITVMFILVQKNTKV